MVFFKYKDTKCNNFVLDIDIRNELIIAKMKLGIWFQMKLNNNSFRYYRRRLYEIFGNPKYSRPALNQLDSKLEKYLDFENGFFIFINIVLFIN